jgi:serine/threonine protein kinase
MLAVGSMLTIGTILGNHWRIERFLGEGACAKVYLASPVGKPLGYEVVAKVISTGGGTKSKKDKEQEKLCNTLYYEYVLYTGLLSDFPFRPLLPARFYGNDEEKKVRYLVMERLDMDLKQMSKLSSHSVSAEKVAEIGRQILSGLQWVHNKGFVFVDVKPDNFMVKNDKIYFVDCK